MPSPRDILQKRPANGGSSQPAPRAHEARLRAADAAAGRQRRAVCTLKGGHALYSGLMKRHERARTLHI